jgi:hypothetical protein
MGRIIVRYIANLLAAFAPLIALRLSPIDYFTWAHPDAHGLVHLGMLTASKDVFDLEISVVVTVLAISGICLVEFIDLYLPKRDLERFRTEYLDNEHVEWESQIGKGVRINVMYARRPWYALWVTKRLVWVWGLGYVPPDHRDQGLCFWTWQGVCGRAFRQEKAIFADLRNFSPQGRKRWYNNEFRISPRMCDKTKDVQAILSVPMFDHRDDDKWVCVGTINLDTLDPKTATVLAQNQKELARYFSKIGIWLAKLRH